MDIILLLLHFLRILIIRKDFYKHYGFEVIARQSKPYKLGDNTYSGFTVNKIPSHAEKFDVVQLVGHDRPKEGTVFRAEDIKSDFKRYCNDDFLLHDMWRPTLNLKDGLSKTWGMILVSWN